MKKVFVFVVILFLMVSFSSAYANHIPMPDLPIGETAYKIQKFQEPCGEATVYSYKQNGFWAVITLDGKWLAVISYDNQGLQQKIWLVRNLDGHINERLDNIGEILTKYPTLCNAVQ